MYQLVLWFLLLYSVSTFKCHDFEKTLGHIKTRTKGDVQTDAVQELAKRILGDRADSFILEVYEDLLTDESFRIQKLANNTVEIIGTTGVAAATGLNYYLKYYCNAHISWTTSQIELPETLPDINIAMKMNDKFRYYQNVCTQSYSFVWWGFTEWEKHIDWMALNSFNLILTLHGEEAIWDRVYKKFNLTQNDVDVHMTGPAFLAWLRMGNMRGWDGPLSPSWHNRSINLQKQVLKRMRDLGMIPVLPAFAGHLPRAFRELYPDVNMTKFSTWNQFNDSYCCPYFLEPTEQLFNDIGKAYMEEQIAEFGTDHVYSCDSFNENPPSTSDLVYLSNVGKSIYKAMTDVDSDAIWLMQAWLFHSEESFWEADRAKALLTSVPIGKMIVLDLQSEQFPKYKDLDNYFGQPYIWCMLHNFGGTLGMHGSSEVINREPISARTSTNSTMIGTGVTAEGIFQNYIIYDLMTETAWRDSETDLSDWFKNYAIRRYGKSNPQANTAWQILQKSIYNFTGGMRIRGQYAVAKKPSLKISTDTWYKPTDALEAWDNLLKASGDLKENEGYLHDLTDLTRQVLQIQGDSYYIDLVNSYKAKDNESFNNVAAIFLQILDDLEEILASNKDFLLGNWVEAAKNAADTDEDKILFEHNAKNQITLWGPYGEILDYATKQWSGVVENFFKPRWVEFITYLNESLTDGTEYNDTYIKNKMFKDVEEPFTFDRTLYPTTPKGDTVEIAEKIHNRLWLKHSFHQKIRQNIQEYKKIHRTRPNRGPHVIVL